MRMSDWSSDVCSSDLVKVATEALDQLQPTAASHSRVMVLEVMGRDAGHIAIAAGIAGGADAILIPELPYSIAGIATKIEQLKQTGRNFALVVVAEAVRTEDGEAVRQSQAAGVSTYGGIGHYLARSEEHTSELQSLMRISYAVFCLKKNKHKS